MRPAPVVVKIGGSLLGSRRLRAVLASLPAGRGIVVVPGGGAFADAVRTTQAQVGFSDALAHRLALDAMGATAQVLRALRPDLRILRRPEALAEAAWSARIPVWNAAPLRRGHPDVPETWGVTSDSLGLWLARTIGAARLVLVKSADSPPGADAAALARFGLVDEAFPRFAAGFPGTVTIHGPADGDDLSGVADVPARAPALLEAAAP
nr:uridylate kinase [Salinarimonas soli]